MAKQPKIVQTPESFQDVHFPYAGVNQSFGYTDQPNSPMPDGVYGRSTPFGLNVRAYDPSTDRRRGGSRSGLSKLVNAQVNGTNLLQEISSVTQTTGVLPGTGQQVDTMLGMLGIFDQTTNASSITTAAFNSNIAGQADGAGGAVYYNGQVTPNPINVGYYSVSVRGFLSGAPNESYTSIGVADGLAVSVTLSLYEAVNNRVAPDGTAGAVMTVNGVRLTTTVLPGTFLDTTSAGTLNSGTYHIVMGIQSGSNAGKLMACAITDAGAIQWSNTAVGAAAETITVMGLSGGSPIGRFYTGLSLAITGTLICGALPVTGVFKCSLTDGTSYSVISTPSQIATQAGGNYLWHMTTGQHQIAATTAGRLAVPVVGSSAGLRTAGLVFITAATGAFPVAALTGLTTSTAFDLTNRMYADVVSDGTNFYVALSSSTGNVPTTIKKVSAAGSVLWTTETTYSSVVRPTLGYLSGKAVLNFYGAGYSISLNTTTGAINGSGAVPSGYRTLAFADGGSVTVGATTVDSGSASGPVEVLTAWSAGVMKVKADGTWVTVNNGSVFSATAPVIRAQQAFGQQYITDGVGYFRYDPSQNLVSTWTATAGTLPTNSSQIARGIFLWQGRVGLWGIPKDPRNLFLSAIGNPFDFDYSVLSGTVQTQAVALNASKFGLMGEVINSCIPFTDDVLYILCANSIYKLNGNPAGGGTLDKVTTSIGGAWGNPWVMDPYGNIYFMSNRTGIYRIQSSPGMQGSSMPVRISQQIDAELQTIDLSTVVVRGQWDDIHQCIHFFVTPFASSQAATHYVLEVRSGSWFFEELPNDMNPLCTYAFQGNSSSAQVCVIGSWDGYLRTFDSRAGSDDGTPIASDVYLGPFQTKTYALQKMKELQATMGAFSGSVSWSVLQGNTAELAFVSGTVVASGTFEAGLSTTQPINGTANATYIRIQSTNPWSLEKLRIKWGEKGGRVGQRGS